jgi:AcrR family transcriptional regulator
MISSPPPPPSKPRRRREDIIREATTLFAERGYEGVSMADLAARVGLRKASLFHHFASKEEIYVEALGRLVDKVREAVSAPVSLPGTHQERLDAMGDALATVLGENPHAAVLLMREVMDWGPLVRDRLADHIMAALESTEAFIRAGQAEGVFSDLEPKHLLITFVGMHFMPYVIGGITQRLVGAEVASPAAVEARREAIRKQGHRLMAPGSAAQAHKPPPGKPSKPAS